MFRRPSSNWRVCHLRLADGARGSCSQVISAGQDDWISIEWIAWFNLQRKKGCYLRRSLF
jgi:hypothetical protein